MVSIVCSEKAAVNSIVPVCHMDRRSMSRAADVERDCVGVPGVVWVVDVNGQTGTHEVVSICKHLMATPEILHSGKQADGRWLLAMNQAER
jgi:hypothetical protein